MGTFCGDKVLGNFISSCISNYEYYFLSKFAKLINRFLQVYTLLEKKQKQDISLIFKEIPMLETIGLKGMPGL